MKFTEIEIFDDEKTLSISDDHSDIDLEFFPEEKKYEQNLSLKEDVYYRKELYEYKLNTNPIEVFIRLKERSDEPPLRHAVKDGVVLESEILEQDHFLQKDFIDNLKKDVEWNKLQLPATYALLFYILSLHHEIVSKEEYRKYLRQVEQRIKIGLKKIEEKLKSEKDSGLQIIEGEYGKHIWYSETKEIPEKEYEEKTKYVEKNFYSPLFDEESSEYVDITKSEFGSSSEILKHIEYLLNKKEVTPDKKKSSDKIDIKTKWFIVIALSIIALSWGIWTAIGAFALGAILINVLSK